MADSSTKQKDSEIAESLSLVHLREVLSHQTKEFKQLLKHLTSAKYSKSARNGLEHAGLLAQTGVEPSETARVRLRLTRPNHKLQPAEINELVRRYVAGESMRSLAAAFTLYDKTVRAHLLRRGVELRQTNVAKCYRRQES